MVRRRTRLPGPRGPRRAARHPHPASTTSSRAAASPAELQHHGRRRAAFRDPASNTGNFYAVYARQGANAFVRSFRVVNGRATDGCGRTDGVDAVAANLGPAFPRGMFVCQDNNNSTPGTSGNQNFKLVPLERVVGLAATAP